MNLKYVGALKDYSGYGEAGRNDVGALLRADVNVITEIPSYTLENADFGPLGEECNRRQSLPNEYKIKILHVTPNVYQKYMEKGKYHVGRVIWETDKLPEEFARNAQLVDEIWTASEANKQSIIKAGVTRPIYVIPEAVNNSDDLKAYIPYLIPNSSDFKFYSMFEWTERKNPMALLEAFWREFENDTGVSLTIKTYIDNFRPEKKREIDDYVKAIKARLQLKRYAPVYLYKELMDRSQVMRFHKTFDCFVSTHRGEGWGIPQMEAMLMGKPIISTNYGGVHEWLTDGVDSMLLNYKMIPIKNNTRNQMWYTSDQNWADVHVGEVMAKLRWAFDNKDKVVEMGSKARETVIKHFDFEPVGVIMNERLIKISKLL